MDKITIVICTYNNAPSLARALANVEQQQACPCAWSLLVVDNNSTDNTAEVVEHYRERGRIPGLRRIVETTQGVAYARRRSILESETEWIAFMDDDCLFAPDWLAEAMRFCDAHPGAGAVGGRVDLQWEVPPEEVIARHATGYAFQDYGPEPCRITSPNGHLVGPGMLVRRRAVLDCRWPELMALVGRNGGKLTAGEDSELPYRIRNAGYELWYDPALRAEHCIPANRMTVDYLCRLYRGAGQSRPFTVAMRFNHRPTLAYRLRTFGAHLRTFGRLLRSVVCDHVLARRAMSPDQRIGFNFWLGQMEGAWQFLLRGYQV